MKKMTLKRLSLSRETIRGLNEQSLAQAAGGIYTQDFANTCAPTPPPRSVGRNFCNP